LADVPSFPTPQDDATGDVMARWPACQEMEAPMDDDLMPLLLFGVLVLGAMLVLSIGALVWLLGEAIGSLGPM
jgi:hypothetical protein